MVKIEAEDELLTVSTYDQIGSKEQLIRPRVLITDNFLCDEEDFNEIDMYSWVNKEP